MSRVLNKNHIVTYGYKKGIHNGIDLVGEGYTLADVIAHSTGTVVAIRRDYRTTDKSGNSYGNYVKIKHEGGYETLYAHMKFNSVCVNVGDVIKCGQKIGTMGATGFCFGAHLHFEVRKDGVKIDPTSFIDGNLPEVKREETKPIEKDEAKNEAKENFKVGDKVIPTKLVDYNGTHLKQYDDSYIISQINGDRAVLTARNQVWAAMNIKNIKHV